MFNKFLIYPPMKRRRGTITSYFKPLPESSSSNTGTGLVPDDLLGLIFSSILLGPEYITDTKPVRIALQLSRTSKQFQRVWRQMKERSGDLWLQVLIQLDTYDFKKLRESRIVLENSRLLYSLVVAVTRIHHTHNNSEYAWIYGSLSKIALLKGETLEDFNRFLSTLGRIRVNMKALEEILFQEGRVSIRREIEDRGGYFGKFFSLFL